MLPSNQVNPGARFEQCDCVCCVDALLLSSMWHMISYFNEAPVAFSVAVLSVIIEIIAAHTDNKVSHVASVYQWPLLIVFHLWRRSKLPPAQYTMGRVLIA